MRPRRGIYHPQTEVQKILAKHRARLSMRPRTAPAPVSSYRIVLTELANGLEHIYGTCFMETRSPREGRRWAGARRPAIPPTSRAHVTSLPPLNAVHFRSTITFVALVATGISIPLGAQSVAPAPAAEGPRYLHFSAAEVARFQAIAAQMEARRESYIRASEVDEIIMLEPYIVEGDSSLTRARIRWALDQDPVARRQVFLGLAPSIQQELLFARQSQDAFFQPGSPGRPSDAPGFNGIDLLRAPQKLRWENLSGLFSAPASVIGE